MKRYEQEMTISTRQSVVNTLCRKQHNLAIIPFFGSRSMGQDYAEILWSNRPEKKDGSG